MSFKPVALPIPKIPEGRRIAGKATWDETILLEKVGVFSPRAHWVFGSSYKYPTGFFMLYTLFVVLNGKPELTTKATRLFLLGRMFFSKLLD